MVSVVTGHLLKHAGIVKNFEEGYKLSYHTLKEGKALPKFYEFVKEQGGAVEFLKDKKNLYGTTKIHVIYAEESGYLETLDALNFGLAACRLGAGRETKDDVIDLFVGLDLHKKIGDKVEKGDKIVTLYHHEKGLKEAIDLIQKSYVIGPKKRELKLIEETING